MYLNVIYWCISCRAKTAFPKIHVKKNVRPPPSSWTLKHSMDFCLKHGQASSGSSGFGSKKSGMFHKLEKMILHLQLKRSFKYFRFTPQSRMNMIQFTELVARMTLWFKKHIHGMILLFIILLKEDPIKPTISFHIGRRWHNWSSQRSYPLHHWDFVSSDKAKATAKVASKAMKSCKQSMLLVWLLELSTISILYRTISVYNLFFGFLRSILSLWHVYI